jgi:hypothetical protein
MRSASVALLLVVFLIGCGERSVPNTNTDTAEPQSLEPAKLSEKDKEELERVVRAFDAIMRGGKQIDSEKAILAFLPTDNELMVLFPHHVEPAKAYYRKVREAIPPEIARGINEKRLERDEIKNMDLDDARVYWTESRSYERALLKVMPQNMPIATGHVRRADSSHGCGPYVRVNNRWVWLLESWDLAKELKLPDS